ncbi:MAG: phosphoribosyl-ATP diphosphatase [Clostridia bacterium]
MDEVLKGLYDVVTARKCEPQEGSYTCYLFEKGLDKILKKVGEECAETIIAAKNGDNAATTEEICDLMYHLMVMMAQSGIPLSDVMDVLAARSAKIGNLKKMHTSDHNS